jgi:hypothetical protein
MQIVPQGISPRADGVFWDEEKMSYRFEILHIYT